jgi:hypothetical protein
MMTVDARAFAELKRRAHRLGPDIPSSKLAEILAAALGYRTHASFRAALAKHGWVERSGPPRRGTIQRAILIGVDPDDAETVASMLELPATRPMSLAEEDVREIIALAEEWRDEARGKRDEARADQNEEADGTAATWVDPLSGPARRALVRRIDGLTKPALAELIALMWIGRGDWGAEDWPEAVRMALPMWHQGGLSYVASRLPLPRYLMDGVRQVAFPRRRRYG